MVSVKIVPIAVVAVLGLLAVVAANPRAPPADLHLNVEDNRHLVWEELSEMSLGQLRLHDGRNRPVPLLLAVKGYIFDVSSARKMYGRGRKYNMMVGKDVTRAVALHSVSIKDMTDDISDLDEATLAHLDEVFENVYMAKYPVFAKVAGTGFSGHVWSDHDEL